MEREVSWGRFVEKTSQGTSRHRAVLPEFNLRSECTWTSGRMREPGSHSYCVLLARCNGESDSTFWNQTDGD